MKKGDRVKTSGKGRTEYWEKTYYGKVVRVLGDSIYVNWDGFRSFEDEMKREEVTLVE